MRVGAGAKTRYAAQAAWKNCSRLLANSLQGETEFCQAGYAGKRIHAASGHSPQVEADNLSLQPETGKEIVHILL